MDLIRESAAWWGRRVAMHLNAMQSALLSGHLDVAEDCARNARNAATFAGTCYRMLPLRTVCAWCHAEMTPGRLPERHGICQACMARELGEERSCPTVTA